jgi:hypothetical protein
MKYSDLCKSVAAMPDADRLSRSELDSALAVLVENNWLVRYGQGELTSYKVNLRRKAGSQLGQDIWANLQGLIDRPSYPPSLDEEGANKNSE